MPSGNVLTTIQTTNQMQLMSRNGMLPLNQAIQSAIRCSVLRFSSTSC